MTGAGLRLLATGLLLSFVPVPALAGPPFMTDDPEPTDFGHWEIYAPLLETEGSGRDFEGSAGAELNYGAAKDLQLTVGLAGGYTHDRSGWRWGLADLEVSAKYRFFNDEDAGLQVAVFPGLTMPTATNGMGSRHVTALLPVWAQQDLGMWSVFGGGGYAINPGSGDRNYWTGGVAVTRRVGERLLVGIEADREGATTVDGQATSSMGLGVIYALKKPLRVLASAGPTVGDHGSGRGFHAFAALGIDF